MSRPSLGYSTYHWIKVDEMASKKRREAAQKIEPEAPLDDPTPIETPAKLEIVDLPDEDEDDVPEIVWEKSGVFRKQLTKDISSKIS